MTDLAAAVDAVIEHQAESGKPLAIILAGHNGSGKSTLWYEHLADMFRLPLINADRMICRFCPSSKGLCRLPAQIMVLVNSTQFGKLPRKINDR